MAQMADAVSMQMVEDQNPMQKGRLVVGFRLHPVQNEKLTQEAGRPIYEDKEFITIIVPGDKNNIVDTEVHSLHKQRFKREYEAWKSGAAAAVSGTPLSEVSWIAKSQAKELEHFHVRTVAELAAVSDANAQNMGPILKLRERAKDYLAAAEKQAPALKLRAELEERDGRIATMERQLKEMGDRLESLSKAKK